MEKILFTGARSGIAKATIDVLKEYDYYIYATVQNEKQLEGLNRIYEKDSNVESFVLDITDEEDRNKFFIEEVKRASENIIYRLQDLAMKM